MTTQTTGTSRWSALNGSRHRTALNVFLVIVLAHWAEHLVQAFQIYVLGVPRPQALGVLGSAVPWLIRSEWLHYGYALVMLAGFVLLRSGFTGRARTWWTVALVVQVWHHFEHLLLLLQALTGSNLLGRPVPTSILQLAAPRVELHLLYNAVVFLPMLAAMYLHVRPSAHELDETRCACPAVARA